MGERSETVEEAQERVDKAALMILGICKKYDVEIYTNYDGDIWLHSDRCIGGETMDSVTADLD